MVDLIISTKPQYYILSIYFVMYTILLYNLVCYCTNRSARECILYFNTKSIFVDLINIYSQCECVRYHSVIVMKVLGQYLCVIYSVTQISHDDNYIYKIY